MKIKSSILNIILLIFLLAVSVFHTGCIPGNEYVPAESGERTDLRFTQVRHYATMRDGVQLATDVYTPTPLVPRNNNEPLGVVFVRTAEGLPWGGGSTINYLLDYVLREMAREKFIFVFQAIRGTDDSEGEFQFMRPPRASGNTAIDETTDAYDTVQWILDNVPETNGRVGMVGHGYDAWLVLQALMDPHPAVRAACIKGTPADMFKKDDFFHNGAFRLNVAFEELYYMEAYDFQNFIDFEYGANTDLYQWYLDLGPLANVNQNYFQDSVPTWNQLMLHSNYDGYWRQRDALRNIDSVPVPILNVAGWFDERYFNGSMAIYHELEKYDTQGINYLVVGPWRYRGWHSENASYFGPITYDSDTSAYFLNDIERKWFIHHLKQEGELDFSQVRIFRTGENQWYSHNQWPRTGSTHQESFYFHPGGQLSQTPVTDPSANHTVSYVSDPANPVPFVPRPVCEFLLCSGGSHKHQDQRFLQGRDDVVDWQSPVLTQDKVVAGNIQIQFYADTTGTDCDWVVKLIDVYPADDPEMAGYQMIVADEVMRAKFRDSMENPQPVTPKQVIKYTIDLNSRYHTFKAGHRVMVQVQSSNFPLIDRNPHQFMYIPDALETDYIPAVQTIHFSAQYPSHVKFPVL